MEARFGGISFLMMSLYIGRNHMKTMRDDVSSAILEAAVSGHELSAVATATGVARIESGFAAPGPEALWERILDADAVHNVEAWTLLGEFFTGRTLVFIAGPNRFVGFEFSSGEALVQVLGLCPGFVFYVADTEFSSLVACNDHDVLIGAGSARGWVRKLPAVANRAAAETAPQAED